MKHRIVVFIGLILLLTASVAYGTSPPNQDMTVALDGLDGEVTIRYDGFGIAHIYASTEHDLFMAQGYVTAQDRWWQMDWSRHQARGELAAIMGESYIETDVFLRTIGLERNAELDLAILDDATVALLEAYTQGVNAWIADKEPDELATEYEYAAMLGGDMNIRPWEPLDTVSFTQAMAILFERSRLENELLKYGLIEAGGPLAPLLLLPEFNYDTAPIINEPGWQPPQDESAAAGVAMTTLDLGDYRYPTMPSFLYADFGSNSWAISGDLTESGMPILANDPHIGQNNPSVWYEVGMHCVEVGEVCNFDGYGYSLPGVPMFIVGHNQHIAWGLTVSAMDTIDIYTLQLNPDDPLQYMYEGEWVDMEVIYETIDVANGEPVEAPVRLTRFGPVIHELVGFEEPMAARLAAAEPSTTIQGYRNILQASNWDEFQQGVALFDIAGQNFTYVDAEGNIGAISAGKIPIRVPGHDGTAPVPGIDSSFEWLGFVDGLDNPRIFNPQTGYIVAANNAFVRPDDVDYVVARYYDFGDRAARIEALLQEIETHTVETSAAMQMDNHSPMAVFMLPALADLPLDDDPDLTAARDWLLEWDMMNDGDSPQAALFNAFWMHLMPLVFDELEPAGGVTGGTREIFVMRGMVQGAHPLWRNEALDTNDSDEIMGMAFRAAWDMLVDQLGDDPDAWRWDALHYSNAQNVPFGELTAEESLGLDAYLDEIHETFNRQIGVGGGLQSLNNQRWDARNGHFELDDAIVSMRMIVDFSDLDNSRFVHELGQSGDPASPHFDDMSPLWANGGYHPYGFTPEAVEAITERTVTLTPAE